MITISKSFEWDMGHRVTNHDSLCKNPHGHRYKLIIYITGPLVEDAGSPKQGMVIDFGEVKKLVNHHVVDQIDHSFMYWEQDEIMTSFAHSNPELKMHSVPFVPTAECIAQYLAEKIRALFLAELPAARLSKIVVHETPTSKAIWEDA